METTKLKRFAQYARRSLLEQVSAKLKLVLSEDSAARRESPEAVKKLEKAILSDTKDQVIERVAYIWFNRFCALRFMDINRYNRVGIVSPADSGQFQPEILAEAKMGHIDEDMVHDKIRQQIFALLDGKAPSRDPQGEAYRLLVVTACNYWNKTMPFLFERIEDYTELLMPDDLLSGNSILAYTREAMTPDVCEDVEVIGWLYQFYISEKKDQVFEGLKKNKKITPENIPAATQLFTPHWIVRYLVENSLGRLWLLNRPSSRLAEQMEYYIRPEQPETDFLRINKPEDIKVCDPACGSGHMLTYAFDLLYAIYEEEGYESAEIPEKIITHNLYGIEIDERAGELAAFALTMKARAKQRRFFIKEVKPNICVLENVNFDEDELNEYMDFVGRDLFTLGLENTLHQFEEANNFGSLIRPDVTDVDGILQILQSKNVSEQLFLSLTHQKVLQALRQADYLISKYHVVIANPPYMSQKGMNQALKSFSGRNYKISKSDLFSMFIERTVELSVEHGLTAMVTIQNWMFLSSFENLRIDLLAKHSITSLVQIGFNSFPELNSKIALACAFVLKTFDSQIIGSFVDLNDAPKAANKEKVFFDKLHEGAVYLASDVDFKKIPGSPIAFSVSQAVRNAFAYGKPFKDIGNPRVGMQTSNNDKFLRLWHEISYRSFYDSSIESPEWIKYVKGGPFRRWYGNLDYLLHYRKNSSYILSQDNATILPLETLRLPKATWTDLTLVFGARLAPADSFHDISGHCFYPDQRDLFWLLGYSNTKQFNNFLGIINSSLHYQVGDIGKMPILVFDKNRVSNNVAALIDISKLDWDFCETSWEFSRLPLLNSEYDQLTLKEAYQRLRSHWRKMTLEMQGLEEDNNRIFIEAYSLQDELNDEVPLNEITLTCNPNYRYSNGKTEEELEALLLADTMRDIISYAVGCIFGRYSLDKTGLILASQGETLADYLKQIPGPTLMPCENNVLPIIDGDWFADDISERFREFLRVSFGEAHYEENLHFIEESLGKKIGQYFVKDFYSDHIKRYKKRPIYWLFSSPKGSFNALIYLHRYRADTVSVVLNEYLREFRTKLSAQKSHLEAMSISSNASQSQKTKALKEIEKINKTIAELEEYEREVLYPLATEQKVIDLDDGVKVNYCKFGTALKKIAGLDAQDD